MPCELCGEGSNGDKYCAQCALIAELDALSSSRQPEPERPRQCADCGEETTKTGGTYDEDRPGVWLCWSCFADLGDTEECHAA